MTQMPEATPEQITENLKAWYDLMAGAEPDMGATVTAQMYSMMNTDLRTNGNEHGTGPQFLLCNTGENQFQLMNCLISQPASIPDMPADSPFNQAPYIAVLENRDDATQDWLYGPVTANEIFGKKTHKLSTWDQIKPPTAETTHKHGLPLPRDAPAQDFFAVLPLFGRSISVSMVELLYPADDQARPTIKAVAIALKAYIESITDEQTQAHAKASLLGLVTKSAQTAPAGVTQVGTTLIDTDAANVVATKAALKAWANPLVAQSLNPTAPNNPTEPTIPPDNPNHAIDSTTTDDNSNHTPGTTTEGGNIHTHGT
ncbi:MAG: hypothetical protein ACRCT2_12130, partial [Plesiomonas shigelloides]